SRPTPVATATSFSCVLLDADARRPTRSNAHPLPIGAGAYAEWSTRRGDQWRDGYSLGGTKGQSRQSGVPDRGNSRRSVLVHRAVRWPSPVASGEVSSLVRARLRAELDRAPFPRTDRPRSNRKAERDEQRLATPQLQRIQERDQRIAIALRQRAERLA